MHWANGSAGITHSVLNPLACLVVTVAFATLPKLEEWSHLVCFRLQPPSQQVPEFSSSTAFNTWVTAANIQSATKHQVSHVILIHKPLQVHPNLQMGSLRRSFGKKLAHRHISGKWLSLLSLPDFKAWAFPTVRLLLSLAFCSCASRTFLLVALLFHCSLAYLSLVVLRRYNLVWCCAKAHCGFTQPTKEWLWSISCRAGKWNTGKCCHPTNTAAVQSTKPELDTDKSRCPNWTSCWKRTQTRNKTNNN